MAKQAPNTDKGRDTERDQTRFQQVYIYIYIYIKKLESALFKVKLL